MIVAIHCQRVNVKRQTQRFRLAQIYDPGACETRNNPIEYTFLQFFVRLNLSV